MIDLQNLLKESLKNAFASNLEGMSKKQLHALRSVAWVEAVGNQFRNLYRTDCGYRVFTKHFDGNRQAFGLNEMLYDVSVVETATVLSSVQEKELIYVKKVLWQVESEFARDSRQAVFDFNKLVYGAADSKLFVGPQVNDCKSFINVLKHPASCCSGTVYLALVPHPACWEAISSTTINLWCFENDDWREMIS